MNDPSLCFSHKLLWVKSEHSGRLQGYANWSGPSTAGMFMLGPLYAWCETFNISPPNNTIIEPPTKRCIFPGWSESSLSAWRKLGCLATNWAHSRLIWVFAGCTCHFVGFIMCLLNYHKTESGFCFSDLIVKWGSVAGASPAQTINLRTLVCSPSSK